MEMTNTETLLAEFEEMGLVKLTQETGLEKHTQS